MSNILNIDELNSDITFTINGNTVILKVKSGAGGGGSGGAKYLRDLLDVTIINPRTGDTIVWDQTLNGGEGGFKNAQISYDNRYIRKDAPDYARELITFEKGLTGKGKSQFDDLEVYNEIVSHALRVVANAKFGGDVSSATFADGQAGFGWRGTKEGHFFMRSLKLFDFLEVPELRYNRVSVIAGEQWNAAGGGIIESVDETNLLITLKLEEGEEAALDLSDICKGIFSSPTGFASSFFRISEKVNRTTFRYALRPNTTRHPQKAMHFVAYGNFDPTKTHRQNSAYRTQSYERYLTGVNGWDITAGMIKMQFGDLSNLKTDFNIDMTGYSAYLKNIYMTGTIKQISGDGNTEVLIPCLKGVWMSGTTYYYYDEVTHLGSTYLCVAKTTLQEPSPYASDWTLLVSKGDQGESVYSATLSLSDGAEYYREGQPYQATATCLVYYGTTDITNTLDRSCFVWERSSGNPLNDPSWNLTHKNIGNVLTLTENDLVGDVTIRLSIFSNAGKLLLTLK